MILVMDKVGMRGALIEKVPIKAISKMLSCDFCLSFWTAVFNSVVFVVCTGEIMWLVLPIFTAPITRLLI